MEICKDLSLFRYSTLRKSSFSRCSSSIEKFWKCLMELEFHQNFSANFFKKFKFLKLELQDKLEFQKFMFQIGDTYFQNSKVLLIFSWYSGSGPILPQKFSFAYRNCKAGNSTTREKRINYELEKKVVAAAEKLGDREFVEGSELRK